jgi:hypothetical protein
MQSGQPSVNDKRQLGRAQLFPFFLCEYCEKKTKAEANNFMTQRAGRAARILQQKK